MKPLLIFDYDGTIHNTMRIYEPAFRQAHSWLVEEGYLEYEEVSSERISGWLGMNSVDMWNDFAPQLPEEIKQAASRKVMESMNSDIEAGRAAWYEGAEAVLDTLKKEGFRMAVLSNCRISYRDAHWKTFDMGRWFDRFYDCESFGFKPKTEIIHEILKGTDGEYIVAGDRKSDMDCAAECGGRFIGCLYGYGKDGELDGSDAYALDVTELASAIIETAARDETTREGNPARPAGAAGRSMLERMNESHSSLTDWGLAFEKINPHDDVLDIGCGGGMTLKKILAATDGRVCGIDYSPDSVMKSIETTEGKAAVTEASVESIPFDDDSFDRIVTVESFYFWPDHLSCLKEVLRVLRPGGVFQIIADTYDNGALSQAVINNIERYNLFVPGEAGFESLLTEAGFSDVRIHVKEGTTWICAEGSKK